MQPSSALSALLLVLSRALAVPVSSNGHHVRLDVGEDGSTVDAISSRWTVAFPEPVSAKTYKAIKFTQSIDQDLAPVNGTTLDLDILDFHTPIDIPATLHRNLLKTPKFFVEDGKDPHIAANLDTLRMEIGKTNPSNAVTVDSLRHLARNLTEFSVLHDWVYWLAHGTLLGEKWGSKILSFDDDLDVQTSYLGLYKLLPQHNKIFNNRYLFQINPWIVQRLSLNNAKYINMARIESRIPEKNVIDARFLDVDTGLFVDITALSAEAADDGWYDTEEGRLLADHNERLHDKSIHTYRFTDISPLHSCEFEGLPAWCPHNADRILVDEYKYESGNPHYETFRFNAEQKTFEELNCSALAQLYTKPTSKTCDSACRKIVQHERQIKWVKDAQSPDECLLNVRVKKLMGEGIELHEDFKFRGRRTTLELPELP